MESARTDWIMSELVTTEASSVPALGRSRACDSDTSHPITYGQILKSSAVTSGYGVVNIRLGTLRAAAKLAKSLCGSL